jgi:hypothetical protein
MLDQVRFIRGGGIFFMLWLLELGYNNTNIRSMRWGEYSIIVYEVNERE